MCIKFAKKSCVSYGVRSACRAIGCFYYFPDGQVTLFTVNDSELPDNDTENKICTLSFIFMNTGLYFYFISVREGDFCALIVF